jgi:ABC-type Mn2+/Zn2+ transport system ATPase subunit
VPRFDIVRQSPQPTSFAAAKVRGMFDIDENHSNEHFIGDIDVPPSWNIGVIVGSSGTGKTTIARELFGDDYFIEPSFDGTCVLDDMPTKNIEQIVQTFNNVGFSSPPSWLKPYAVLSNGEKMRVQLAYAILSDNEQIVFDEYTSVVDRTVAKIGSAAIAKAIRTTQKRFIAVTCHFDVLDWLEPDWVFDTNTMTMQKKTLHDQKSPLTFAKSKDIGQFFRSITI